MHLTKEHCKNILKIIKQNKNFNPKLIFKKKSTKVPFAVGTVANESVMFIDAAFKTVSLELYIGFLTDVFGPIHAVEILRTYPLHLFGDDYSSLMSFLGTHYIFTCPTRKVARDSSSLGSQTFLYWFNHVLSFGKKGSFFLSFYFCCFKILKHGAQILLTVMTLFVMVLNYLSFMIVQVML
jgi:hypothetical protein